MKYETKLANLYKTEEETEVLYEGFSLLEEKAFDGPTSVKYWM